MAGKPAYANKAPDGYTGPRCEHGLPRGFLCGLPAWEGAPEGEPRCAFHSEANPDDIRDRLQEAVQSSAHLIGANLSDTKLIRAKLSGGRLRLARLRSAELGWAELSDAYLEGADLSGADLGYANLSRALLARANLPCADVGGANLSDAYVGGANLSDAYVGGANLSGAYLWDANLSGANLTGAELSGALLSGADVRCADLRGTRIGALLTLHTKGRTRDRTVGTMGPTDLRGGDLRGAHLSGAAIAPETKLEGACFGRCPICPPEDRIRDELDGDHHACAQVYRQLKLALQQSGDYERAGRFYFREMQCLRHLAREEGQRLRHAWLWVLEWLTGYGEDPWRVVVAAAATVLLFALLQGYFGGVRGEVASFGPGIEWVPSLAGLGRLGMALYFSFVTFTTLGYGDVHPATGLGRTFSSVEAVLGMILMSLFLVCVARRFSR